MLIFLTIYYYVIKYLFKAKIELLSPNKKKLERTKFFPLLQTIIFVLKKIEANLTPRCMSIIYIYEIKLLY